MRSVNGIHAYLYAEKNGEWLTMSEAAFVAQAAGDVAARGVLHHVAFLLNGPGFQTVRADLRQDTDEI